MWKKLENLPRHENAHAFLKQHFDDNTSFITDCFDRTTEFSSAYPCTSPGGDGCPRRACKLPDGKWVAVCGDSPERCDEVNIEREDTRVYQLNLKRLGSLLAERLQSFGVSADVQVIDPLIQLVRVGYYIPRGTVRFPVFFHLPLNDGDLPKTLNALSQTADAFILMLPTLDLLRTEQATGLRNQKSLAVGVDSLDGANGFDATKTAAALSDFISLQPESQQLEQRNKFDTPAETEWKDIAITFMSRDIISIKCGSQIAVNYERLHISGMFSSSQREKKPTKKWYLLMAFALWGPTLKREDLVKLFKHNDWEKMRAQKSALSKSLKEFFSLDSDPINFDETSNEYQPLLVIRQDTNCDLNDWINDINN